jgi:hypothetical protein
MAGVYAVAAFLGVLARTATLILAALDWTARGMFFKSIPHIGPSFRNAEG